MHGAHQCGLIRQCTDERSEVTEHSPAWDGGLIQAIILAVMPHIYASIKNPSVAFINHANRGSMLSP